MKPPFTLTPKMLKLCTEISRDLGTYDGLLLDKPAPQLRKSNRIRTIQASLAIEGNTLDLSQVTAVLEGRRILGTKKEIQEVQNAIHAYDLIMTFKPFSVKSLCLAHGLVMKNLAADAGKLRNTNVGVFKGTKLTHTAPQAKRVPELMTSLFSFLKNDKETHPLILSAICHYEIEFIHPFSDGNGRIGRLWQTRLLANFHPLFQYIPVESAVKDRQLEYYNSLGQSDKTGSVNPFVEFSLLTIKEALGSLSANLRPQTFTSEDRLEIARDRLLKKEFTRKDYLEIFKNISTATASRDLALGVKLGHLKNQGEGRLMKYRFSA